MAERSDSHEQEDDYSLATPDIDYGLAEEYKLPNPNYFNEDVTGEERAAMDAWEEQHPYDRSKMRIGTWQKHWYAALGELRLQRAREQVEEAAKPHVDDTDS